MFGSVHTHVAIRPKLDSIGLLILTFLRNKRGWMDGWVDGWMGTAFVGWVYIIRHLIYCVSKNCSLFVFAIT